MNEQELRRKLAAFPIDLRMADVCTGCGYHMLDDQSRLDFLYLGGTISCPRCGTHKTRILATQETPTT